MDGTALLTVPFGAFVSAILKDLRGVLVLHLHTPGTEH